MIKIWGKLIKNDKIIKQTVVEIEKYDFHNFYNYMVELSYRMDIPTPIVINNHIVSFTVYNTVRFKPSDFAESVEFDYLQINYA